MAKRIMRAFRLDEISGVDRPAQEHAKVKIFKREDTTMPDQISFLAKARDTLIASFKTIIGDDKATDKDKLAAQSVDQFVEHVTKALAEGDSADKEDDEMSPELMKALGLPEGAKIEDAIKAVTKLTGDADKAKDDEIKKLKDDLAAANKAAEIAKAGFSDEENAWYANLPNESDKEAFRKADKDGRAVLMKKREPQLLEFAKVAAEKEALEKRVAKLEEEKQLETFKKQAVDLGLAESEGVTLMQASKGDKAAFTKMQTIIKQAIAAANAGDVFKEFGVNGGTGPTTAYEELMALAALKRKTEPNLSEAQAFNKVFNDPANSKLAQKERDESRRGLTASVAAA